MTTNQTEKELIEYAEEVILECRCPYKFDPIEDENHLSMIRDKLVEVGLRVVEDLKLTNYRVVCVTDDRGVYLERKSNKSDWTLTRLKAYTEAHRKFMEMEK